MCGEFGAPAQLMGQLALIYLYCINIKLSSNALQRTIFHCIALHYTYEVLRIKVGAPAQHKQQHGSVSTDMNPSYCINMHCIVLYCIIVYTLAWVSRH